MKRFKEQLKIIVGTDVVSRGLDFEGIKFVINYDVPMNVQDYIHRVGRAGRKGLKGTAITLVKDSDRSHVVAQIVKEIQKCNQSVPEEFLQKYSR